MKPPASLSLDLDNQWSYMKTHGDAGWESFPSYLPLVIPRILAFLAERGLTISFFVVGQDAALECNRPALRALADAGHEIGNHSFHHQPWLHLYSESEIEDELARAERVIEEATGRRPRGFRGPGFSLSAATLRVLTRRGYHYDASTFPTFLGPLARAYYFLTARMSPEERRKRAALFGTLREGLRPNRPYRWALDGTHDGMVEIPVTTLPVLRTPIHFSYIVYLGARSPALARAYFESAMRLCRATGTQPSLLLHSLDFLGREDVDALAFFPGMNLSARRKLELVGDAVDRLTRHFRVLPLEQHAREAGAAPLRRVTPRFAAGVPPAGPAA
jgi:peptidoglycan-N-acetylglucosamine deacetylase